MRLVTLCLYEDCGYAGGSALERARSAAYVNLDVCLLLQLAISPDAGNARGEGKVWNRAVALLHRDLAGTGAEVIRRENRSECDACRIVHAVKVLQRRGRDAHRLFLESTREPDAGSCLRRMCCETAGFFVVAEEDKGSLRDGEMRLLKQAERLMADIAGVHGMPVASPGADWEDAGRDAPPATVSVVVEAKAREDEDEPFDSEMRLDRLIRMVEQKQRGHLRIVPPGDDA